MRIVVLLTLPLILFVAGCNNCAKLEERTCADLGADCPTWKAMMAKDATLNAHRFRANRDCGVLLDADVYPGWLAGAKAMVVGQRTGSTSLATSLASASAAVKLAEAAVGSAAASMGLPPAPLATATGQTCPAGKKCTLSCNGGSCALFCAKGSTCDATCNGGKCTETCQKGATCMLTCNGGKCAQSCADASCTKSCLGGNCS